jgi:predicted alpha-1,2-mannosidase
MKNRLKKLTFAVVLLASHVALADGSPVDWVDPSIGAIDQGSCMPGPVLPHASIYPSPDTLKPVPSGYSSKDPIVGFSQLHTQGTGGVPSYGNFLISPQIGLQINEADHQSAKDSEVIKADRYSVKLTKYDIACQIIPASHSALYKFTFPRSGDSHVLIDVARKIGSSHALQNGDVKIDPKTGTITGGGTFNGNWVPRDYKLFFCAKFSKKPTSFGTWKGNTSSAGSAASGHDEPLGLYCGFDTKDREEIYLKIAVSFKSVEQASKWLDQEIPAWNAAGLQNQSRKKWNDTLGVVDVEASPAEKRKFTTALWHAMVQPRDRTGDNWDSAAPFWDDHYTLWDSWKTLFPLLNIVAPNVVRDNVNSFIARHQRNPDGYVATAFVQGQEFRTGQGGDEVDNIITDAYLKGIQGVDWNQAYHVLRNHAETARTPNYREKGFVSIEGKNDYDRRIRSGSSTVAFAYNDYSVAQLAKALGHTEDAKRFEARAQNWQNVWDASATDGEFSGFIKARHADGTFSNTSLRQNYSNDFYEASCWIASYAPTYDMPQLIGKMGGKEKFTARLVFALKNNLIDFGNEPSFMTIWLFDAVNRPYLCSYWANELRNKFKDNALPGDDDQGAMSSLYCFLTAGFFPIAGQDIYYLHGARVPKVAFKQANGKTFTVLGKGASPTNIYVQSATLNGKPLEHAWIRHADIAQGGILEFVMGDEPSGWGCNREFDLGKAGEELGIAVKSS